jgi:hypothetical protein
MFSRTLCPLHNRRACKLELFLTACNRMFVFEFGIFDVNISSELACQYIYSDLNLNFTEHPTSKCPSQSRQSGAKHPLMASL